MKRFLGIFLLLAIAPRGAGALTHVHELAHPGHEDAGHHHHDHDESNCAIFALMKLPMLDGGYVPLLVCVGVLVAFLTLLPRPVRSRRPAVRLDSRGPPR